MSKRINHFESVMFEATKFSTAEDKAKFGNDLLAFIESNFLDSKFTKKFYERLHLTFGFIAHNNRDGFFATYFTSTEDKIEFLKHLRNHPCYGDAGFTYSDVEKATQTVLAVSVVLESYEIQYAAEVEQTERNMLYRLKAKYEPTGESFVTSETIPALAEFLSSTFPVNARPLASQGMLF